MNIEQKLIAAFDATAVFEPSSDLWQRVTHSIEEDEAHRRRVRAAVGGIAVAILLLAAVVVTNIDTGRFRSRVDWRVLEAVEFVALATLVVVLGPAIRRFGRGFAHDLFRASPQTADHLLGVLDVAYYLVFAGFVLATTRLSAPVAYIILDLGDQLQETAMRIGGLLMVMGLLHGLTFMLLPLLSLVMNSNRVGAKLPRWVSAALVLVGVQVVFALPMILGGVISLGAGE